MAVDYSAKGQKTLQDYLKHKADDIEEVASKIWEAWENREPIGVISLREASRISLLLVASQSHPQGIAKRLFLFLRGYLAARGNTGEITINSSPYAVEVYRRLGFKTTDTLQEQDGIKYVPMVYKKYGNTKISRIRL